MEEKKEAPKQSIFRKKALDRISSPEDLDQYLTVTGPGVWLPLLAVIILLAGGIVWMIFGHVDSMMTVPVEAGAEGVVCYVPIDLKDKVLESGSITIGDGRYAVKDVGFAPVPSNDGTQTYAKLQVVAENMMSGTYEGRITVESVNPIRYITN